MTCVISLLQWLIQVPEASTFMGCIGKDEYGKELEKKASEAGLKVVFQLHDTVPTGTCAVALTGTNRWVPPLLAGKPIMLRVPLKMHHLDL